MSLIPYSEITSIQLGILSTEENIINSNVTVLKSDLLHNNKPEEDGLYDAHMGTTDTSWECETCLNSYSSGLCPGHFGVMHLNYPVYSPMFMKYIINYLKIICFKCGKIIINYKPPKNLSPQKFINHAVKLIRQGKKIQNCVHCGELHPYIDRDMADNISIIMKFYKKDEGDKKETVSHIQPLYPHQALDVFNKIPDDVIKTLGFTSANHPKKLISPSLPVPPNVIRPDIKKIGQTRSNSNDLTVYLQTIYNTKNSLPATISTTLSKTEKDNIYNLNLAVYEYIKGTSANSTKRCLVSSSRKKLTSISGRWPGKFGRIRRNLNGRRVTDMARSYITCDTTLELDQLGLPQPIAQAITVEMPVREYNYQEALVYFNNGSKIYPGAKTIIKPNGNEYNVDIYNKTKKLEYGDKLTRHVISGDIVNFNRFPSLESSSISSLRARVNKVGKTIGMNISDCNLFNADFDGDAMNCQFSDSSRTMHEIENLSGVHQFFISYKTSAPKLGQVQDSLSAIPAMTYNDTRISKFYAMQIFNRCKFSVDLSKYPEMLTGRDLITIVLKTMNLPVNYTRRATVYDAVHAEYIKFDPDNIHVNIENGVHLTGILDKSSVGQDVNGSIFHIINNQYDVFSALNALYNIQQLSIEYQLTKGMSVSIRDFVLPMEIVEKIHQLEDKVVYNSYEITEKLNRGNIIPPLGKTLEEYYEDLQINELTLGDDLWTYLLSSVNAKYNNLYKLIAHGAKGKFDNYKSIISAVGQLLPSGRRMPLEMGGRSLIYFTMNDPKPAARGYIGNSYLNGLNPFEFFFHCIEARGTLVTTALQTGVTGDFNRKAVKNLESMIVTNMRTVMNDNKLVQFLFGGDGIDTRNIYAVRIPTMDKSLNDKTLKEKFHSTTKMFGKAFQNAQKVLDEEFVALQHDREEYIKIFLRWELNSANAYKDTCELPLNIKSLIENTAKNYSHLLPRGKNFHEDLNPIEAIAKVRELCDFMPYIMLNEIQYKKKTPIPEYFRWGVKFLCMALRSLLCTRSLLEHKINNKILDIITNELKLKIMMALMIPGRSVGILSAQAYSEPLTQLVLDSKHTSGVGKKKTGLFRVEETLRVKPKEKMRSPGMTIRIIEKYETDKFKAQEIAHNIEMIKFGAFIKNYQIFFEEYKKPRHPKYKHEKAMIEEFEKYNVQKASGNLINYCIRVELDKYKLVEKHMNVALIHKKIKENFPFLHVVYTVDNAKKIIFRFYMSNTFLKNNADVLKQLKNLLSNMEELIVRGIDGITNAQVSEMSKTVPQEDGSLVAKKIFYIYTAGVNFLGMLKVPYIDYNTMQTDSILDTFEFLDIVATRNKIINELRAQVESPNFRHFTIYGDEMTYMGFPTSIDRYGSARRNKSFMLKISDASPKEVVETAAANNMTDYLNGVSAPIIMGKNPHVGVMYNKFIVDDEFVNAQNKSVDSILDSL